jgi:hypothetical protein
MASIETRSPAGIVFRGQIWLPRSWTGIKRPVRPPVTKTASIFPPPSGIPIRASAAGSVARLALAEAIAIAPTARAITTAISRPATTNGARRRRRTR